jgi:hypothetical protein
MAEVDVAQAARGLAETVAASSKRSPDQIPS